MIKPFGIILLPLLIIIAAVALVVVVGYVFVTETVLKNDNANATASAVVNRANSNTNTSANVNVVTNSNSALNTNANTNSAVNTNAVTNINSTVNTNNTNSTVPQLSLTRVGIISTGEGSDPVDVAISGSYVYLADGVNKKLQVINVSNPAQPTLAGSNTDLANVLGVDIVGNRLYVSDAPYGTSGLTVFSIDQPVSPVKLGFFERLGSARIYSQVKVVGDYAYLPAGPGGLEIISISNPASPTLAGSVDTEGRANDVAVVSQSGTSTAYIADSKVGQVPGRLYIINASTPSSPTVLGIYQTDGEPSRVNVNGTTAYLADGSGGLDIIDVGDSRNPQRISTVSNIGSVKDVIVDGTTAFVSTASSVVAIDISVPASPRVLTSLSIANAFGLAFANDYLYVAGESGLVIIRLDR